jgi:hypothetical protein
MTKMMRVTSSFLVLASLASGCDQECEALPGNVCTVIGTGEAGIDLAEGGPALNGPLYLPQDLVFAAEDSVFLADWNNARIREWNPIDGTIRTAAGTGVSSDGPPGPALESGLNHMTGMTLDGRGGLLIAAWHNSRVKRLDLATRELAFECGNGSRSFSGDGGPASIAGLDLPVSIAVDSMGRTIIADQANNRIRRVELDGTINTVAGTGRGAGLDPITERPIPECVGASINGTDDCFIDGDLATATLNNPRGQAADPGGRIVIDGNDILYVADTANNAIRRIDFAGDSMTTIAGLGPAESGYSGDGGPAREARFNRPSDLEVMPDGTIYVADTFNHCVRRINPEGIIDTVAGVCGQTGELQDGQHRLETYFDRPYAIAIGLDGNLYVADTGHNVVRVVYLGD